MIDYKKMKKIVDNAGEIQYYSNIINEAIEEGYWFWFEKSNKGFELYINKRENGQWIYDLDHKLALFFLKDRKLKAPLSNRYGRYLGHRAYERKLCLRKYKFVSPTVKMLEQKFQEKEQKLLEEELYYNFLNEKYDDWINEEI